MAQLTIQQSLNLALQHHRSGRLAEAEQMYRQVLARQPNQPDALHLLGVVALQTGRSDVAVELIRRAVALRPNDAALHSDLGNAWKSQGQLEQAAAAYRQAIALRPGFAAAHYNLGNALQDHGQLEEAIAAYRRAISLKPDYADAHYNLGNALKKQGQLSQAAAAYRQVIALQPGFADAHYNLGNALKDQGQLEEAMAAYRRATTLKPDYADAHCNLGNALRDQGQVEEAVAAFRRAIVCKPGFADAHCGLGNALKDQGQLEEAAAACRRAIALKPEFAEAHSNLGNVLKDQGQLAEAVAAYRQAIVLKPDFPDAHCNLGVALQDQGQLGEAVAAYRQAIVLKPGYAEPHYNLGMALLLHGEFPQGWEECEWRWRSRALVSVRRNFSQPQWDGQALEGRTLLLYAEQGLGDTMQFIRYLPLVVQRVGQGHLVLECQAELLRLLKPLSDGGSTMLTAGCQLTMRGQPLPAFDLHCPLLSLPLVFASSLKDLPRDVPYLRADPSDIDTWRQRLAALGDRGPGTGGRAEDAPGAPTGSCIGSLAVPCPLSPVPCIKVGLVWAGNPKHKNDHHRSIPLSCLAGLGGVPQVRFVSLQKGPAAAQVQSLPPGLQLLDLTRELRDMADTAALIANLDLVIGVDTAVVHLAGAMAKPVWTLLPWIPDWRWLLGRDDSPWYPSMRLFRQPKSGDWDTAVAAVAEALSARAETGKQ